MAIFQNYLTFYILIYLENVFIYGNINCSPKLFYFLLTRETLKWLTVLGSKLGLGWYISLVKYSVKRLSFTEDFINIDFIAELCVPALLKRPLEAAHLANNKKYIIENP